MHRLAFASKNARLAALAAGLTILVAVAPATAESHPFDVHDLVTMNRLTEAQVSPDGRRVAYVLRTTDLEADRGRTDLWLLDLAGGEPRQLTFDPAGDSHPRFAADGSSLYFLSSRSGSSQVWRLPLAGGEARPVTALPLDVGGFALAADGRHLLVGLDVFVDCPDLDCTAKRLAQRAESKRSGQLYDRLFIRHWDTWKDGRRGHLFALPLAADGALAAGAAPVDLTAGLDADVPTKPWGDFGEVAFTPDGQGVVFTAKVEPGREPWSTNFDLYLAPLDGAAAPRRLTTNPAWDTGAVFSPDGKTLAYRAMARPGFEADRFRIVLRAWPDGGERVLAEAWDRSADSLFFSADGKTLYATATDDGEDPLVAIDVASGRVEKRVTGGRVHSPQLAGKEILYLFESFHSPLDLWAVPAAGGAPRRLTEVNREKLAAVRFGEVERLSFVGAGGDEVHGWVTRPVDFDPARRYPVAFLIHGGPQGSWQNGFHYRWNPQVYAGAGYGVVVIDYHGSTGYGQAFTDAIRDDWGGKPLEDLQKGLAAAAEKFPWLDTDRACALGASYGGYMINWIAGNWQGFRCLVNHDGLFDLRGMYYATEEIWFPEWEFVGAPWANPEGYRKHNPADHVDRWQTPMLVVHGGLDYRVTLDQGLSTFTALQRRGVPSQLLYYPDENHWVLKPGNSIQWHETVLEWLGRWTAAGTAAWQPEK